MPADPRDFFDLLIAACLDGGEPIYAALGMNPQLAAMLLDGIAWERTGALPTTWGELSDWTFEAFTRDHHRRPRFFRPPPAAAEPGLERALDRVGETGFAIVLMDFHPGQLAVEHREMLIGPFGVSWRGLLHDEPGPVGALAGPRAFRAQEPPRTRTVETAVLPLAVLRRIAAGEIAWSAAT